MHAADQQQYEAVAEAQPVACWVDIVIVSIVFMAAALLLPCIMSFTADVVRCMRDWVLAVADGCMCWLDRQA